MFRKNRYSDYDGDEDEIDDEEADFFTGPDLPEPQKKEKEPELKPDDPDYWEREESQWSHLRLRRRTLFWWILGAGTVVVAVIVALWMYFFAPYVEEGTQYGYVESLEKRGYVFKTWEGVMIPYKEMMDTTRIYRRDFPFSVERPAVVLGLKRMEDTGLPVKVTYRRYRGTLPWRGSSGTIVVAVDSADPRKILPPEFRPEFIPEYSVPSSDR